jgi:hypothetical protein
VGCALLLLLVGGCSLKPVHVLLRGFRSGDVDGIWLWRQQSNNVYSRLCRFVISNSYLQYGIEVVSYDQICNDGSPPFNAMQAQVTRDAANPDNVTLRLQYQRGSRTPGTYRASAYNKSGESVLSSGKVNL